MAENSRIERATPAARALLDLIVALRKGADVITGEVAFALALLIHEMKLDSPCQWGNAYFRCPRCGHARDCHGDEFWDQNGIYEGVALCGGDDEDDDEDDDRSTECHQGGSPLYIKDLRLSEGWVDRVVREMPTPAGVAR